MHQMLQQLQNFAQQLPLLPPLPPALPALALIPAAGVLIPKTPSCLPERLTGDSIKKRTFLAQCNIFIGTQSGELPMDRSWVYLIVSLHMASTTRWSLPLIEHKDPVLDNFQNFLASLDNTLGTTYTKKPPSQQLCQLHHGNNTLVHHTAVSCCWSATAGPLLVTALDTPLLCHLTLHRYCSRSALLLTAAGLLPPSSISLLLSGLCLHCTASTQVSGLVTGLPLLLSDGLLGHLSVGTLGCLSAGPPLSWATRPPCSWATSQVGHLLVGPPLSWADSHLVKRIFSPKF
ncbi:PEG10: Retrotransposon-derived protein PEG10 [Crotalus adamanteus]|uniref:PEG10: Retrotransposon-derived protein PEG10 n=1 Tax=Crotalus adamanteus TaxID=8729 RepID=A0AAW1B149_CROAD